MWRRLSLWSAVLGILVSVVAVPPAEAVPQVSESAGSVEVSAVTVRSAVAADVGRLLALNIGGFPVGQAAPAEGVGLGRDRSRGVPGLLVAEQAVTFGRDGSVVPNESGSPLDSTVRLVRPESDSDSEVVLSTLDDVSSASVSSLGFGFELTVDRVPGAARDGRAPVVPGRGPDGRRRDADLGDRSGWQVEFDLDLFSDVLIDVGRVQFEVGLGCGRAIGCGHTQLLPSTVDFDRGVVVVEVPRNVLAAVSRSDRGNGNGAGRSEGEATQTDTTEPSTETTEPATTVTTTADSTTTSTAADGSSTGSSLDEDGSTSTSAPATDGESTSLVEGTGVGSAGGGGTGSGSVGFGVRPSLRAVVMQGSGSSVYFGASGGASGPQGDYSAGQLSGLSSWQVGLHTGSAELSYNIPVPGPLWGHVPSVGFSYSSGSVDGLNSSSNAQPSQVGVGWSMPQAVITRETRGCAAGGSSAEANWAGNLCMPNNSLLDGFAISFDGVSGPLVRTSGATGADHPQVTGAK